MIKQIKISRDLICSTQWVMLSFSEMLFMMSTFFFAPSCKHGKMHCNLLEHWWRYLSNSGQRIVSKVMKSFGIFFMFFLFLFFFLLVMRIDQPEWLIDSNNDNFSGELPMIQRICVNNKLILCIKSLTLWGCVSL